MEEWRDIEGFEGIYQVSNMGRVRSLAHETNGKHYKGKILSSGVSAGYHLVRLSKGNEKVSKRVHRLVAEAFIENLNELPEVNHLDGNKNNNCVENLEWCTSKENKVHAWVTGLTKAPPAEMPKAVMQYDTNILIAVYKSIKIASMLLDISSEDICKCCKGKRKSAGGYVWKYAKEGDVL